MAVARGGASSGRITADVEPGTLVRKTVEFVSAQLPRWRDDPERPVADNEVELTVQLCKFLMVEARKSFSVGNFLHEEPQGGRLRRVDLSVSPNESVVIDAVLYNKYDVYLLIECKRLPSPGQGREQEYVTGGGGGIRRFKVAEYGPDLAVAVIIGYVQSGECSAWHSTINQWIAALAADPPADCAWELADQLEAIATDSNLRTSTCESNHSRVPQRPTPIRLVHLWVQM